MEPFLDVVARLKRYMDWAANSLASADAAHTAGDWERMDHQLKQLMKALGASMGLTKKLRGLVSLVRVDGGEQNAADAPTSGDPLA